MRRRGEVSADVTSCSLTALHNNKSAAVRRCCRRFTWSPVPLESTGGLFLVCALITLSSCVCFFSSRFPSQCGVWGALSLCQHVDGQDFVSGSLCHHGHICKSIGAGHCLDSEPGAGQRMFDASAGLSSGLILKLS